MTRRHLGDSSLTPVVVTGDRKLEAAGVVIGGTATAAGLLFLAKGHISTGYAILIATAVVGSTLTAVRIIASTPTP